MGSGFLIGVVSIVDHEGKRVDTPNVDGDHSPVELQLGSTMAATKTTNGALTRVTINATAGEGGVVLALDTHEDFRDLEIIDVPDGTVIHFKDPPGVFVYEESLGAGQEDDDRTILKLDAVSDGSNGRAYNVNAPVLPTIASLRLAVSGKNEAVLVQSFSTSGDGGGGQFIKRLGTPPADDGGVNIVPTGVTTFWYQRQYSGALDVRWFGARWTNDATSGPDLGAVVNAMIVVNRAVPNPNFPSGNRIYIPDAPEGYFWRVATTISFVRPTILVGDSGYSEYASTHLKVDPGIGALFRIPKGVASINGAWTTLKNLRCEGVRTPFWKPSIALSVGEYVMPMVDNGHIYKVTASDGLAGATEPTWPLTDGGTVTSDGITYQEAGQPTAGLIARLRPLIADCSFWWFTDTALRINGESELLVPAWSNGMSLAVGDKVKPSAPNGYYYRVIASDGAAGAVEPTWPTVLGKSVTMDGVTYRLEDTLTGGVNCNHWRVRNTRIVSCQGHGMHVTGLDGNAGKADHVDISYTGKHGVLDVSDLGNTYDTCHVAATYHSADATVRANYPNAIDRIEYEGGGTGVSSSVFVNCYGEAGGYQRIREPACWLGSHNYGLGFTDDSDGMVLGFEICENIKAPLWSGGTRNAPTHTYSAQVVPADGAATLLNCQKDGHSFDIRMRHLPTYKGYYFVYANNEGQTSFGQTDEEFSRGGGMAIMQRGFFLNSIDTTGDPKFQFQAHTKPGAGAGYATHIGYAWLIGDRFFYDTPVSAGYVGRVCTRAGKSYADRGNNTVYALNTFGEPVPNNGHYYKITTAGTSAGSQPVFNTGSGSTTTDGTCVWTEQGVSALWEEFGYIGAGGGPPGPTGATGPTGPAGSIERRKDDIGGATSYGYAGSSPTITLTQNYTTVWVSCDTTESVTLKRTGATNGDRIRFTFWDSPEGSINFFDDTRGAIGALAGPSDTWPAAMPTTVEFEFLDSTDGWVPSDPGNLLP